MQIKFTLEIAFFLTYQVGKDQNFITHYVGKGMEKDDLLLVMV